MGRIMQEDDLFIPGLLDLLNLRFGPSQGSGEAFGGIEELAELQRVFQIFQRGRSLRDCFAVLNLGGFWNVRAKNRWLTLIEDLSAYESDDPDENGNDRIMNVLIDNLQSRNPLPVLFQAHDSRGPDGRRVIVRNSPTGLFYVEQEHIIVSLPMRPKTAPRAAKKAAKAQPAKKGATKASKKAGSRTTRKPTGRR